MQRSAPVSRWFVAALLSSLVAALILLDGTQAQTTKGKKYALLVGVREYDSAKFPTLEYTENDADDLAEVLAKQAGFSVRVLTTSRGKARKEDSPTGDNLRAAIQALLAKKTKHDTVLVALAGHGMQARVKEGGAEKDESFFCPSDAQVNDTGTLLGLSKLFADLDECGARVKLLLVDACRNEPGTRGFRNLDADAVPRPAKGIAALFSCSSGQRAFETDELGPKGHGVFFHFVLEGLKGKAKNSDNEVTWARLAEHVTRNVNRTVPKLIGGGARQTPHLLTNLEGESPVLIEAVAAGVVRDRTKEKPGREEVAKGWGKTVENSIGMTLVRIPKGTFTMGSPADEEKRRTDEAQHQVEITKDFWLGVHEVTQKEFKDVMGYNPSYFSIDGEGKTGLRYFDSSKPAGGKDKVAGKSTDDFPVENVSHEEAVEFCEKLTARVAEKRSGRKYCLPTEAEWEYSCRGGGSSSYQVFHFGNSLSSTQANFDGNYPYGSAGKGVYLERTCKVGSHGKNRFGVHDMHGNVWEWCSDWYDKDYYGKSPRRDPPGPSEGSLRVLRGGSWSRDGLSCRSADRSGREPADRDLDLGFRVALVPVGP
jgi:formylglycine-generating enzyme required for sulfatase activity